MKVVFDTYALIKWLLEEPGYEVVEKYLTDQSVYMSLINFGETYYRLVKNGFGDIAHNLWANRDVFPIKYVEPNWSRVKMAAELKAKYPISYADAFCLALALEINAPVVTGDPEFKKVEGVKLIWVGSDESKKH